jgi:glycosyltransferase involved in cell wall biosynthesis
MNGGQDSHGDGVALAEDVGRTDAAVDQTPLSVCFVCSDYPPGPHGGIGTMTQLLARALAARGHQVRVAGVYPETYPAEDREEDHGVQVYRLRERRAPLGWVAARMKLAQLVSRWSRAGTLDVVEVPDWQGWAAGWPRLPVPVVARLNGSAVYFAAERGAAAGGMTRRLEARSIHRADFVCSASLYTGERTAELFGLRADVKVLYNPVEPVPVSTTARVPGRVVFTGTLTEKKGVVSLVRAWPLVLAQVPEAQLHLYGKDGATERGPSMRAHLQALLPASAASSVHFHGHVPRADILAALAEAWVAVFPSHAEAFALAPLEAMACGAPTVYSRRGSGPELIRDGRDGLLIDPDRPDDVARALLRVLHDETVAGDLSAAGRRRVEDSFGVERIVAENIAFYRRCLATFRRRPAPAGR